MSLNADPNRPRPVVLCILDGWGDREPADDNAISAALTPNYSRLLKTCPHALIATSGADVGLPDGQMGNSEVGHMNIGSGRIVMQDLPRIDKAVADGTLGAQPALADVIAATRASGGTVHLMGLLSPGGVHSHQGQMAALANTIGQAGVPVAVHAFLDGRDTPPKSAIGYVRAFLDAVAGTPNVRIATLSGRYYGMDRDKRWERVELAWNAIVLGEGVPGSDAIEAIEHSYEQGVTDEFVLPAVMPLYQGVRDGDGLVMANFRADRAREILTALVDPAFDGFVRKVERHFAGVAGMVEYSNALNPFVPAIFPPERVTLSIGELASQAGLKQLRIAETEKYAHVTFFLNGGEETVFEGEDRILVPSPKVATYDLDPAMAAVEVTDRLVAAVGSGTYDLIVVNYANPDMVGHTGLMPAAVQAVETIDACLGRLSEAVKAAGGILLITADHGNCEQMLDPVTGEPHTAHTLNKVPAILVNAEQAARRLGWNTAITLSDGRLSDLAPTLLRFLGLPQPPVMTGRNLLEPATH
ncbi:2,3-bisphosphoglycerate-independent phosphoglycerate mutase [Zavarzinia sp. CC-PAN008]|uniref:2,3-bisphosphoglycerate-independent phosphoglycerate mutase n=1 Tax=Zavarzinia sp. CC-PAN008 TaxID=3243332 RepID=UPI003F74AC2D